MSDKADYGGFLKFPSVESFAHAHRNLMKYPDLSTDLRLGAKIKLHGTNAGVRLNVRTGEITAQSRNRDISVGDDNAGFAAFVEKNRCFWDRVIEHLRDHTEAEIVVFYGEWAGPGIQKNDAVTKIPAKTWFLFSIRLDSWISSDPDLIADHFHDLIDGIFILDWMHDVTERLKDFNPVSAESVGDFTEFASKKAEKIGEADPFVLEEFGISGEGEGFVVVPLHTLSVEVYRLTTFKVKCERHRVNKSKKAATTAFMVPDTITDFLNTFLTEQRFHQAVQEACDGDFDKSKTSLFLKWVGNDVRKESEVELQEAGFDWKQVAKHVNKSAVTWWINECEKPVTKGLAA